MRDKRWNAVALLILRISQLVLAVIALGLAAFFIAKYPVAWYAAFTLTTICLTVVWIPLVLGLFFTGNLLPLVVIIVDVLIAIFYIISIATIADYNPEAIGGSCAFYTFSLWDWDTYLWVIEDCDKLRGLFAILVLEMLTFIGAIIWDGVVLYQNRSGRAGAVDAVAQNAMYGGAGAGRVAAVGGTYGVSKPMMNDAAGYYGGQTSLPQYQPMNSPTYPPQVGSPISPYSPYVPPPVAPTMPQQAAVMQHQHQNHLQQQQVHQLQQQQRQHQQQQQPQQQHHQFQPPPPPPPPQQQQQNQGPLPHELGGMH
ncbi:unnamed protein product [Tuber melanosporum]|jgi:hypothetical protein|uniref:(Perigord truffle) hypothetical protein n=1 Tax=Tuber melanosporum (strain Mel28) TaxID=656061 RepID=D5G7L4_TUBMM|nr:uncharacterized protein GSTUM_00004609001 [Tuber melanosporum]CAZ80507.1 unnamed protein product [Tuber melanosporum]